jgi:ABC-type arginine/histidine transport system permease subunit
MYFNIFVVFLEIVYISYATMIFSHASFRQFVGAGQPLISWIFFRYLGLRRKMGKKKKELWFKRTWACDLISLGSFVALAWITYLATSIYSHF